MKIIAVRLRPRDKKHNFMMATYTSARSRTKYVAGSDADPSAFRIVTDEAEINELSILPQFEILSFNDMEQLREHIQSEMEGRARQGLPAVRAAVMPGLGANKELFSALTAMAKKVTDKLPPEAGGTATTNSANTGRVPLRNVRDEIAQKPMETTAKPPAETLVETRTEGKRGKKKKTGKTVS